MRCASYARYMSCIPQKEIPSDIIRQQNERIQKFIKQNKWELVERYADRKQDMEADDAFREMQKDGVNRKFDMVVVDSLFRCGANVSYAEDVLLKSFYPAGIHFAVVEDNICSLYLTADEAAAYFKRRRDEYIVGRLRFHSRQRQAEGYYTVHDEKYGYLLDDELRNFSIDTEVVPIIREIFELVGEKGFTYKQAAEEMNRRGIEPPMKHLARVGRKKHSPITPVWTEGSIKRITDNTVYIGYWYKVIDGVQTKLTIEPIIEQELFDKIVQKNSGRPTHSGKLSVNDFSKQIFDKKTGAGMICRLHKGDNPYQTFSTDFWNKKRIAYEYVMEETVSVLRREQKKVALAKELITSENGQRELSKRKEVYAVRARELFAEMNEIAKIHLDYYSRKEHGELSEEEYQAYREAAWTELEIRETEFKEIMEAVGRLETAYSNKNPWLVLYGGIKIPETLTKAEIRKWIDRVLIEDIEKVEVILPPKYTEWRDMLPDEWWEGE